MKQIIAAKLKLITEPQQFEALRQTQLMYRDALNKERYGKAKKMLAPFLFHQVLLWFANI